MSRKRVRRMLSAALGLLSFGAFPGVTSAAGKNDGEVTYEDTVGGVDMDMDEDYDPAGDGKGAEDYDSGYGGEGEDEPLVSKDKDEISEHLDSQRRKINELQGRFLSIVSKWGELSSVKVGGTLTTSGKENINKLIRMASNQKDDFDRSVTGVSQMISDGKSGRIAVLDAMDRIDSICENYAGTVDQLNRALKSYEESLGTASKADEEADAQKRKANAALLGSMRNEVGEYLKKVRLVFKGFTDVKGRLDVVNAVSAELSELRRQLDIKMGSGVGDDEYNALSKKMQEMKTTLADIERSVKEDKATSSRETDHSRLNRMLLEVSQMWQRFSTDCNPRKLSAAGMSKDSVEQCQQFYKMVKEHYVRLRKTIREKITASINTVSNALSPEIDNFYKKEISDFNSKIVSCKSAFDSVQKYESARQGQLSPAEYRQKMRSDFINECRSIRDRGELTKAEMLDELVSAMNKILPGREAFHRQVLDILARDVQIDARGEIDSTSLLSKNILFIGAPGNGKTEEAIAAAEALGLKIIRANGDNFATEAASYAFANDLVNETLQANSRFVIFFDEIDSIFTNRAFDDQDGQHGAVAVFNNFIDNYLKKNPELMKKFAGMMATTNMAPRRIDQALLSRFPQMYHMPKFDEGDARQFLRAELEPISFTANTTKEALISTLANVMVNKGMDARAALKVIDEVYAHAKSVSGNNLQDKPGTFADDDIDVGVDDVIVDPSLMSAGFNGMKLGGSKGRGNAVGGAETRPSTPLRS